MSEATVYRAPSLPPGISASELTEPESRGARIVQGYCPTCHALPSPDLHSGHERPAVVDRMIAHVNSMDREPPEPSERKLIVAICRSKPTPENGYEFRSARPSAGARTGSGP